MEKLRDPRRYDLDWMKVIATLLVFYIIARCF